MKGCELWHLFHYGMDLQRVSNFRNFFSSMRFFISHTLSSNGAMANEGGGSATNSQPCSPVPKTKI